MIERRKTKRGELRYEVRLRRPDGREHSRTFRSKKEAERYQATERADRSRGTWIDPTAGQMSFADWAGEWYETMEPSWRPRTAGCHAMALRVHWVPRFGSLMLSEIKPRQVQAAINQMAKTYRPSSLRTYYGTLRSLFRDAVDLDLLGRSPCRSIKLPALVQDDKRVVTPAELHRLADAIGPDWRCLVLLAGVAGLRFGEAVALRVGDVHFAERVVTITRTISELDGRLSYGPPKTAAGLRTLAMPAPLMDELQNHLTIRSLTSSDDLLFGDENGGPIRRSNFARRIFSPAVDQAGLTGLTFHGLRHSAATQWVAAGLDPRTVQHRLGHADPRLVLKLYAHVSSKADRRAADESAEVFWSA